LTGSKALVSSDEINITPVVRTSRTHEDITVCLL